MAQAIVTIDGFLSKDAELRWTKNGSAVLSLSIPVTPQKKVGNGWENTGPTQWYEGTIWGTLAETYLPFLLKGTRVEITGPLTTREHEGRTYQQVKIRQLGIIEKMASAPTSGGFSSNTSTNTDPWQTGAPPQQGGFADEPPF